MKKTKMAIIAAGVIFLISGMVGLRAYAANTSPEGTYLVIGLTGLAKIEWSPLGFSGKLVFLPSQLSEIKHVYHHGNNLVLITCKSDSLVEQVSAWKLKPSEEIPGDWDLVAKPGHSKTFSVKRAMKNLVNLNSPLPSYLHRVEDILLPKYFGLSPVENSGIRNFIRKLFGNSPKPPVKEQLKMNNLEMAKAIFLNHPKDPYIRVLYLDALLRADKLDEFNNAFSRWQSDLEASSNPGLIEAAQLAEMAIESHKLSATGQNAYDYIYRLGHYGPRGGISVQPGDTYVSLLEKAAACKSSIPPVNSLLMENLILPNFLAGQVCSKVLRTQATFAMLKGDNEKALHLLTLTYRLGQLYCGKTWLISNLIGVAVRAISCGGMEIYLLNACHTPDDVKAFFDNLQNLRKTDDTLHWEDIISLESPIWSYLPEGSGPNLKEAKVRWNITETKSLLLVGAAAARYRFLKNGEFPKSAADFAPLLSGGPPEDPFGNQPLRFISEKEPFVIYSIGPDEKDNAASITYDPTNGTVSRGDIFIKIPRKRKYPFPPKGKLATTKQGLLKQFPNGLPPDIFHRKRGALLSITDTVPAKIVSFGPDGDWKRVKAGKGLLLLDPPYDPTNGTVSNGDLILDTGKHF